MIEECIEENLTHLEEFCTMLDLIRNDNNGYLSDLVPEFKKKKQQLRTVYAKIDKMLELVDMIKHTVDLIETELNKAELKFNNPSKLTKFISSLIGNNSSDHLNQTNAQFNLPTIFKTDDYFQTNSADSKSCN